MPVVTRSKSNAMPQLVNATSKNEPLYTVVSNNNITYELFRLNLRKSLDKVSSIQIYDLDKASEVSNIKRHFLYKKFQIIYSMYLLINMNIERLMLTEKIQIDLIIAMYYKIDDVRLQYKYDLHHFYYPKTLKEKSFISSFFMLLHSAEQTLLKCFPNQTPIKRSKRLISKKRVNYAETEC